MKTPFLNLLSSSMPLADEIWEEIEQITDVHLLSKGTLLLTKGQVSDSLFYLCQGMARAFYHEKEEEITSWIVADTDFIYSPVSFIQQKPSFETIQLLEDSIVLSISREDLEKIYKKHPEVMYLSLRIMEKYVLLCDERVRSLRLSAEERYWRFQRQFPQIVARVKVQYLASYLGLSRSSVNQVRSKK